MEIFDCQQNALPTFVACLLQIKKNDRSVDLRDLTEATPLVMWYAGIVPEKKTWKQRSSNKITVDSPLHLYAHWLKYTNEWLTDCDVTIALQSTMGQCWKWLVETFTAGRRISGIALPNQMTWPRVDHSDWTDSLAWSAARVGRSFGGEQGRFRVERTREKRTGLRWCFLLSAHCPQRLWPLSRDTSHGVVS